MLARSKLNSIETLYLKHLWILTLVMKNTRLLLTKKRITEHLKKENIRNLKNDKLNEEAKKKKKMYEFIFMHLISAKADKK